MRSQKSGCTGNKNSFAWHVSKIDNQAKRVQTNLDFHFSCMIQQVSERPNHFSLYRATKRYSIFRSGAGKVKKIAVKLQGNPSNMRVRMTAEERSHSLPLCQSTTVSEFWAAVERTFFDVFPWRGEKSSTSRRSCLSRNWTLLLHRLQWPSKKMMVWRERSETDTNPSLET